MTSRTRLGLAISAILLALGCARTPGGGALPGSGAPAAGAPAPVGGQALFTGRDFQGWEQVGAGRFALQPDGSVVSEGGPGLLYYKERPFRDFVLELDYRAESPGANSGILLRVPAPPRTPDDAARGGYEIDIDDTGDAVHTTGAVSGVAAPSHKASRPAGQWNHYRVEVSGQRYRVFLNGEQVNDFFGTRGREGYLALQNHDVDSRVHFRNVRVTPLEATDAPATLGELFAVRETRAPIKVLMVTATTGWRHTEAIDAAKEVMAELDRTTEFDVTVTEDVSVFSEAGLAGYDLLLLSNATLRAAQPDDPVERREARNHDTPAPALTKAQEQAMLGFVRAGKGLVVTHSGVDAFYGSRGYREMIGGGLFASHPWTQHVRVDVEEPGHPAVAHLGDSFGVRDEIYVLDQNPRWNSRVLLSIDMPSVGVDVGHADATPDDYPVSWVRTYGQGKVFVTTLGHFGDVWRSPAFLQHLLQGMRMAAGRVPGDFTGHRVKETIAADVWPDDLAIDDRGNVWIAELTGKMLRYDPATRQTTVIGQLETTDPTNIEHGLMGIEVDPNFHRGEPYLYVYYTKPESFVNTLSRFTVRDGKVDMGTERVLLRVPTEPQCCHQAGDLEWGPDGTLFISTGDTGQSSTKPDLEISDARIKAFLGRNNLKDYHWSRIVDSERTGQNLQDLRGKVLRVNRDGSIPKSNPFYGRPGVRWEIFAYGLRNPYRIKWDDQAGRLFIGVVGPDEQTTYDWYDIARGGENFGWPRVTGRLFYNEWSPQMIPGYVPSAWEYTYATGSRSASGGPMYRSTGPGAFPQLQGKVLMYDWSRRWIKYGEIVNGTFESDTIADVRAEKRQFRIGAKRLANIKTFDVLEKTSPISMEVGPDGCIYVAEFAGFWGPAPGSNVSRYCWVQGTTGARPAAAVSATTTPLTTAPPAAAPPAATAPATTTPPTATPAAATPAAVPTTAASTPTAAQSAAGARIYGNVCGACHQAQGTGVAGVYPPLAGSEWVTGAEDRLVRVILHGLTGDIRVRGATYSSTMPPFGSALQDADIAAVATYIRTAWGNRATPVSPASVARVRRATAARTKPWTAAELNADANR